MTVNGTESVTTLEAVCTRKDLSEGLQIVGHAVSERNPLPILNHILIQSHENGLLLSASDMELGIAMTIPADLRNAGAVTVPAKLFSDLISSFPEGEITISSDRSNATRIFVPGSQYKVNGLEPEEYPNLPVVDDTNSFTVPEKLLRDAIRQTIFSVLADAKGRPILSGVLVEFDGSTVTLAATDTLRLAMRTIPVKEGKGEHQAIVPARALNDLQRALSDEGDVRVCLGDKLACFSTHRGVTMTTRLIEGAYPPYRRVIPNTYRTRVTIPTAAMQQAVRRINIVARHGGDRVEFTALEDKVVLVAEASTEGRALEEVEAIREGDDIRVILGPRFLLDILGAMDTEGMCMDFTDPTKAIVVRPKISEGEQQIGEYLCIIMPLQLF